MLIWFFHFKFLAMITPRKLKWSTNSMLVFSMFKVSKVIFCCTVWKSMAFVLFILVRKPEPKILKRWTGQDILLYNTFLKSPECPDYESTVYQDRFTCALYIMVVLIDKDLIRQIAKFDIICQVIVCLSSN